MERSSSGASPDRVEEATLTIGEFAAALGVSAETVRRWENAGRIEARRTPGGHRRFRASDLQSMLTERGAQISRNFRARPPARPLPALARLISQSSAAILARARKGLYTEGAEGWFATDAGRDQGMCWLEAVGDASQTGDYTGAVAASRALGNQARVSGVSLLECDSYLELVTTAVSREISRTSLNEAVAARLVLVAMRQAALDLYDPPSFDVSGRRELQEERSADSPEASGGWTDADGTALNEFLSQLVSLYDIEEGAVFLADPSGLELRLAAHCATSDDAALALGRVTLGQGPIGRVALERRARILPTAGAGNGELPSRKAILAAPFSDGSRPLGVICLAARSSRQVTERELMLLSALAERLGAAAGAGFAEAAASLSEGLSRFRAPWLSAGGP